ncbi:hypothetical protein M501DRAFT_372936 [Patellaria atrata CBS 101060]|uniref:Uncharacterized protein n=1 Tax=Patellaria atrata CBS 101060 TaxID=1346257 RepID=A0A9P4VSF1_9PEZI|nr:hypothetical protein M501DRAFT_372936 [Patellaria atrata CBS 101060]
MAHSHGRLAPSAPKDKFYAALGWPIDSNSEGMYQALLREVDKGRQRLIADPNNLQNSDPKLRPPYSWAHISESAKHKEVREIFRTASPIAAPYFQYGEFMDGQNQDNWVIRWLLWHTFRYKDSRNVRVTHSSKSNYLFYEEY